MNYNVKNSNNNWLNNLILDNNTNRFISYIVETIVSCHTSNVIDERFISAKIIRLEPVHENCLKNALLTYIYLSGRRRKK